VSDNMECSPEIRILTSGAVLGNGSDVPIIIWPIVNTPNQSLSTAQEESMGVKKSGKGRRKLGRKKRRMRAKIRHRK